MNTHRTFRLEKYREYLHKKELSQNTVSVYLYAADKFLLDQGREEVTQQSVETYASRIRDTYKKSTSNLYLIALNQYLIWLGLDKYCVRVKGIQRKKRAENVLDKDEYKKLLSYVADKNDRKYYAIIKTLAGTGIRISELRYITTDTVCLGIAEICNKGKTREVYIGEPLKKELLSYCELCHISGGVIFRGNKNTPITRSAVNQKLMKIARAAGVDTSKVHPHAFRHLFAKEYMKKYRNIAELSCILGHESVETTMIYLANSRQEYIERLSGLDL